MLENVPVIMSKSSIKKPYLSKKYIISAPLPGKTPAKILEPSRGGIGIKLKAARMRFIYIKGLTSVITAFPHSQVP